MKMIHKVSLAVCVSTWRARWLWSHHLSLATLAHFGKEYDDGMWTRADGWYSPKISNERCEERERGIHSFLLDSVQESRWLGCRMVDRVAVEIHLVSLRLPNRHLGMSFARLRVDRTEDWNGRQHQPHCSCPPTDWFQSGMRYYSIDLGCWSHVLEKRVRILRSFRWKEEILTRKDIHRHWSFLEKREKPSMNERETKKIFLPSRIAMVDHADHPCRHRLAH